MNDMMPMGSTPLHICSKTGLQAYLELRRTVNPTKLTGYKYSSLAKCIQFASLGRIRKNLTFLLPQNLQNHMMLSLKRKIFIVVESPDNPKNGKYNKLSMLSRVLIFEPGADPLYPLCT